MVLRTIVLYVIRTDFQDACDKWLWACMEQRFLATNRFYLRPQRRLMIQ
jgi:hypothetical protein